MVYWYCICVYTYSTTLIVFYHLYMYMKSVAFCVSVLVASAFTLPVVAINRYVPSLYSASTDLSHQIDILKETHKQELSMIGRRQMLGFRNFAPQIRLVETSIPEVFLESASIPDQDHQEVTQKQTIMEIDIINEYWQKIEEYVLPDLAKMYLDDRSDTIAWVYTHEWVYSVLLEDGTMMQYGRHWVFLTVTTFIDWPFEIVANPGPLEELLDTWPTSELDQDSSDSMYWSSISIADLPLPARYDVASYASQVSKVYKLNGVYTVLLNNGTILKYGKNGVFYSVWYQ